MDKLEATDVFGTAAPLTKLVDQLEDVFPLRTPTPNDSHAKLMYEAGQRSVIDYIVTLQKDV
jgi:hypothetical protein